MVTFAFPLDIGDIIKRTLLNSIAFKNKYKLALLLLTIKY